MAYQYGDWKISKHLVTWPPMWIFLCLMILILGFYPYGQEYHKFVPTSGVVASVNDRLVSTGKGMEQKFVVKFEDDDQEYGCLDTRCALIEVGDTVTINCIKEWDYQGADGYDCKWGSRK